MEPQDLCNESSGILVEVGLIVVTRFYWYQLNWCCFCQKAICVSPAPRETSNRRLYSLRPSCTFLQSCCEDRFISFTIMQSVKKKKKIRAKDCFLTGPIRWEGWMCRVKKLGFSGTDFLKFSLTAISHRIIVNSWVMINGECTWMFRKDNVVF